MTNLDQSPFITASDKREAYDRGRLAYYQHETVNPYDSTTLANQWNKGWYQSHDEDHTMIDARQEHAAGKCYDGRPRVRHNIQEEGFDSWPAVLMVIGLLALMLFVAAIMG